MKQQYEIDNIPAEQFEFAQLNEKIHDTKFETKPIGYFKDAWLRFKRNKGSIAASIIIILIVIFGVIVPFVSPYTMQYSDGVYSKIRPKIDALSFMEFFDGGKNVQVNEKYLAYYMAMGVGAEDPDGTGATWKEGESSKYNPLMKVGEVYKKAGKSYQTIRLNSYTGIGFKYQAMTLSEYEKIQKWQEDTGIQVLYPLIDTSNEFCTDATDANFWYKAVNGSPVSAVGKKLSIEDIKANGFADNYLRDDAGNVVYHKISDKSNYTVRILYYNYYQYKNGFEPSFYFGTDGQGYDIFVRLAFGIRLSLALSIFVSIFNLGFGSIYGAVEGYYGGAIDLIGERIGDILNGIPFIVLATLIQLHLVSTGKISTFAALLFAFFLTGWLGTAYNVRTQFYRFKNQEYVIAARTLGARDRRLMFKHIFPNSLGTIITSSVLVIPYTIFTESVLSYLGIANFQGKNSISLGTLLSNGEGYLSTDPHIIFFPAVVISLLMISFNLFGNGLRDAFNPSLRGSED